MRREGGAATGFARGTRRAYAWLLGWADRPSGPAALVAMAVAEAFLFPAPTEALFLALGLGRPRRAWGLAALATLGSLTGAAIGYVLGATLFEAAGRPLLAWSGLTGAFQTVGAIYRGNVYLALGTSGYTPIPYMLYTIAAGAFRVPLVPFVVGSLVGRGLKFLILAGLVFYLGPRVRAVLDRYLGPVLAVVACLLVAGAVVLRLR